VKIFCKEQFLRDRIAKLVNSHPFFNPPNMDSEPTDYDLPVKSRVHYQTTGSLQSLCFHNIFFMRCW